MQPLASGSDPSTAYNTLMGIHDKITAEKPGKVLLRTKGGQEVTVEKKGSAIGRFFKIILGRKKNEYSLEKNLTQIQTLLDSVKSMQASDLKKLDPEAYTKLQTLVTNLNAIVDKYNLTHKKQGQELSTLSFHKIVNNRADLVVKADPEKKGVTTSDKHSESISPDLSTIAKPVSESAIGHEKPAIAKPVSKSTVHRERPVSEYEPTGKKQRVEDASRVENPFSKSFVPSIVPLEPKAETPVSKPDASGSSPSPTVVPEVKTNEIPPLPKVGVFPPGKTLTSSKVSELTRTLNISIGAKPLARELTEEQKKMREMEGIKTTTNTLKGRVRAPGRKPPSRKPKEKTVEDATLSAAVLPAKSKEFLVIETRVKGLLKNAGLSFEKAEDPFKDCVDFVDIKNTVKNICIKHLGGDFGKIPKELQDWFLNSVTAKEEEWFKEISSILDKVKKGATSS